MMLLMSNLVNYTRIFKTLQILIKTLSACGQHVLFLHCNMLYISIYIYIYISMQRVLGRDLPQPQQGNKHCDNYTVKSDSCYGI